MSDFTPTTPISLQIRKIIFEKFNDVNVKFTNDEIFEIIKKNGDFDPSWIIDDTESFFNDICNSGLARNIAQNFTTIWMNFLQVFYLDLYFIAASSNALIMGNFSPVR
jgi:hypothetical protein